MRYIKYKKINELLDKTYHIICSNSEDKEADWKFVMDGVLPFTSYTFKSNDKKYHSFYVEYNKGELEFSSPEWKDRLGYSFSVEPEVDFFGRINLKTLYFGIKIPEVIEKNLKKAFDEILKEFSISRLKLNAKRLQEIRGLKDFGL